MIRFDALAAAMLMAATVGGTALAGDLPPEINVQEVSVKDARGFYGRADLGYAIQTNHHDARLNNYDSATGIGSETEFDTSRFSGGKISGSVGIGYQFNDLFRADITGDLFRGDFDGGFSSAAPCAGGAAGTGCSGKNSASYSAGSLLANGYVDIGTVAGFTPYVGAGLGATRVSWGDVGTIASCIAGASACGGSSASSSGEDSWRFTYALMAGVAYQIAPNIKLDLGYRYSHAAGGDMFSASPTDAAASTDSTTTHDGGIARQEIRLGLRITSW